MNSTIIYLFEKSKDICITFSSQMSQTWILKTLPLHVQNIRLTYTTYLNPNCLTNLYTRLPTLLEKHNLEKLTFLEQVWYLL